MISEPSSQPMSAAGSPDAPMQYRLLIFAGVVLGANLQTLDTTMATVALPQIQGTLSATQDEIAWVLASYLIGVAIVMPLVGTLTQILGRKRLFLITVVGFCIASVFTGSAESLQEIVIYRFFQGVFASALSPISQSFVFDAYPPEERGRAMGWWSLGVMTGIVLGPALGGYLAEFHSWRWAFYLNVPFGVVAFTIICIFAPTRPRRPSAQPFGLLGYLILSVGLVAVQVVLSRGERMDWFSAPEIVAATILAVAAIYLFVVHTMYSSRPFIAPAVFKNRNFAIGLMLMFMLGIHWLAFLALVSPFLQTLAGYPVFIAGLVLVPQAIGNATGSMLAGQLLSRIHPAPIMIVGIFTIAWANWQLSLFTPDFDRWIFYVAVFIHGFGIGFYFVPLTVITFSTLPRQSRDVGTGLFALMRNYGSSVGVSLTVAYLVRQTQSSQAILSEHASAFNETLRHVPLPESWSISDVAGLTALNAEATRQAAAVAYSNDFIWLAFASLVCVVPLFFVRMPAEGEV
jgi:DHA2 family multidrug resistance protein